MMMLLDHEVLKCLYNLALKRGCAHHNLSVAVLWPVSNMQCSVTYRTVPIWQRCRQHDE